MSRSRQQGMALLAVLLLVAVMTVLIVAMLDDVRFGQRRTGNSAAIAQAQRYALGSEDFARASLQPWLQAAVGDGAQWNGRQVAFPVEQGRVEVRVDDGSRCFNLISVVAGAVEQWQRHDAGVASYRALLAALGFDPAQAQALADTLVDWIDTDPVRSPAGAEDIAYAGADPGYRTAGALLAEPSELRALHGYTSQVYARLRPHVCALPVATVAPVNVNLLAPGQGALVSMLSLGAVSAAQGERIIAARPAQGWADAAGFWAQPALAGTVPGADAEAQVVVRSRYFDLRSEVELSGVQVVMSSTLALDPSNRLRVVARRWTLDE